MMKAARKYAHEVMGDAILNKGSAFTRLERDRYRLSGLLPSAVESVEKQIRRETSLVNAKERSIDKYMHLMQLLDRNQSLFYSLVKSDINKFMPLIYTPTVGEACQQFSRIWTQPRGMYLTRREGMAEDNIVQMLSNWHTRDVKAIVFTDGQRILGLGDLGINGMGIPVGKLQLYSACAGISPEQCLPVVIDNGTNNKAVQTDDFYLGKREDRVNNAEYYGFIRNFMKAAQRVFGENVLLQFEDFGNETAFDLLKQNQYDFNCFNDDIQGTASVALAGILASLKVDGVKQNLADHKILFLGAGEAGTGIGELVAYAIEQETNGTISKTEACARNLFFVDSKGLISTSREDPLPHHKALFEEGTSETCKTFLEAVKLIQPTMIIGVSAQPNTFTEEICKEMAALNERPVIFALSNPTEKSECTAEEAYRWTNNRCIFASGSPFPEFNISQSKSIRTGQGNNAYIFPGLALGAIASKTRFIPEKLFFVAAKTLAELVTEEDREKGAVYPPLNDINATSLEIATEVALAAFTPMKDPRAEDESIVLAQVEVDFDVNNKTLLRKWVTSHVEVSNH